MKELFYLHGLFDWSGEWNILEEGEIWFSLTFTS